MDLSKPYNSAAFCSLSSLYDANKYFEDHDGLSAVENHLKPLFLNHGVVDKFGVALVHRHFDLDDGKVLVEKDLTTTPWRVGASFEKHGGNVIPSSWFYSDDNPTPYEFNFVPFSKEIPPRLEDHRHFVEEFFNIVKQHGLQKVIGLRRSFGCNPTQMLECTEGDTNILFLGNEIPSDYMRNGTNTMWFFDGNPPHQTYRCSCMDTGSPAMPSHHHIDRN